MFARVGGPDKEPVEVDIMMQINSGEVLIDDIWMWRADHSVNGLVKNSSNPCQTGLQVNADNVKGYGLAVEHTLGNLLEWNGNNGKTYFFQSELPYDVTQENFGDKGYAGYKVGDNVTTHDAYGIGVYTFFRDYSVTVTSGIKAPELDGINFVESLAVHLSSGGGIINIINHDGKGVGSTKQVNWECDWKDVRNKLAEDLFLQK